jgi:hypothetical protein
MKYTILSKELLDYWLERNVKASVRQKYLLAVNLSIVSAKTGSELTFMSDCAYVWTDGGRCLTMKWEELNKIEGEFSYISPRGFKIWFTGNHINNNRNEDRLQNKKTDVVRGDDTERSGIQGRRNKASTSVGHLSNQAVHS